MAQILSYFFSLFVLGFIYCKSEHSSYFLGVRKDAYKISFFWILIFVLYATYMFEYIEYNSIISLACIGLFFILLSSFKDNAPFHRSYLIWYTFFVSWCAFSIFYTKDYVQWFMMMVKLVLPIIYFKFCYKAFCTKENIWLFFEKMAVTPVYFFILTLISYPFEEIVPIYQYFGMAVMVFPLIMFCRTGEKKYLFYCLLCLSGNLIEIKRTPLLGMVAMLIVFFSYRYRWKAIVPIILAVVLFVLSIFYVPAIRDRMFFEGFDISSFDYELLFSDEVFEIVNTNGRSDMWGIVIEKFYKGHEYFGAGLGTMKGFLLSKENDTGHFLRLHNDWLHLLCEVGRIGVTLLLLMFLSMFRKTYISYKKNKALDTKLIILACPMASIGTAIHMLFENCVGVFGYYIPFIFAAIYFRYMKLVEHKTIK